MGFFTSALGTMSNFIRLRVRECEMQMCTREMMLVTSQLRERNHLVAMKMSHTPHGCLNRDPSTLNAFRALYCAELCELTTMHTKYSRRL